MSFFFPIGAASGDGASVGCDHIHDEGCRGAVAGVQLFKCRLRFSSEVGSTSRTGVGEASALALPTWQHGGPSGVTARTEQPKDSRAGGAAGGPCAGGAGRPRAGSAVGVAVQGRTHVVVCAAGFLFYFIFPLLITLPLWATPI